ncbi:MAG: uroporphyrinogen-III synthase [Bacteroidota bacterium]|nr:uroporphyrinogen-III synthase [Bacteroidota bacterium]
MQQNKTNILSTRPLDASLVNTAKQHGIDIDILSFIETEAIQTIEIQQEIENALLQSATVVFTSMNAVEAVADQLQEPPDWSIYCIGTATHKLVKKYFGEETIAGTAPNAAELAELIVEESGSDEVIFFCGDQRRDELPGILQKNNIEVNEIVVYHTVAVPHKIKKEYQGILYFSPSTVESFFRVNKLTGPTLLFAIGNTTASEIIKYSTNKIIISDEPGKEHLVKKMINYFSKQ